MIYISSSSFKFTDLDILLNFCKQNDIKNLELSGGLNYKKNIKKILFKNSKNFNFNIHNYFPPPKKNFIINLGSINEDIRKKSINLCKKSIDICKKLNLKYYSIHAPFLVDFAVKEAGKDIKIRELYDYDKVIQNFKKSWEILSAHCGKVVQLYLENNVLNKRNYLTYNKTNPFLLTNYKSYLELKKHLKFKILLDLAHLRVTSQTLKNNFFKEAHMFAKNTDYFHISDNNGLRDENNGLKKNSKIYKFIKEYNFSNNSRFTLEIYKDLNLIKENIRTLNRIL